MDEKEKESGLPSSFPYKEIYFLSLESQSNIYCCTRLEKSELSNDDEKLLVGSLRGTVSCIECKADQFNNTHKPAASDVYFTYIPGDAEIISIDAFSRVREYPFSQSKKNSMVIAISLILVKVVDGVKKCQHFLNFYKAMDPDEMNTLKDIARGCQHIELNFTPFHLTHASIHRNECKEMVFLLSGSDNRVHLFMENEKKQKFEEHPTERYFPEFKDLPSRVIWMDIKHCENDTRISAFGCQNGFIKVTTIDKNLDVLKCHTIDIGGLVTSVSLFTIGAAATKRGSEKRNDTEVQSSESRRAVEKQFTCEDFCLLVTCAMQLSVVYLNVHKSGFDDMVVLPQSDHFDSVICSAITDFDLDGSTEIILGTYGQELLVYKSYRSNIQIDRNAFHFDLQWTKSFPRPIFAIKMVDLTKNGLRELAVVTLNGIHVLQFDVYEAADIILQRLKDSSHELEDQDKEATITKMKDQCLMSPIFEEDST